MALEAPPDLARSRGLVRSRAISRIYDHAKVAAKRSAPKSISPWVGTATRWPDGGGYRPQAFFGGVPVAITSRVYEVLDDQLGNVTRKFTEAFGCP